MIKAFLLSDNLFPTVPSFLGWQLQVHLGSPCTLYLQRKDQLVQEYQVHQSPLWYQQPPQALTATRSRKHGHENTGIRDRRRKSWWIILWTQGCKDVTIDDTHDALHKNRNINSTSARTNKCIKHHTIQVLHIPQHHGEIKARTSMYCCTLLTMAVIFSKLHDLFSLPSHLAYGTMQATSCDQPRNTIQIPRSQPKVTFHLISASHTHR